MAAPAPAPSAVPRTSVSIDWILAQTGPLMDGSVASLRFRENVESAGASLVELEAWSLQALERTSDPNCRNAFQDLIHAVAKRLGLKVQYGSYDRSARGWLPFDGLWWLDSSSFACIHVCPERLTRLEIDEVLGNLESIHELGGVFAQARGSVIYVLAQGYAADLEPALRTHGALHSIRLLGVDTLFDIARMRSEGVLSAGQVPVLFAPFDSMRVGQVVDFLERFVSRFEEGPEPAPEGQASRGEQTSEGPRLRVVPGGGQAPDGAVGTPPHLEAVPAHEKRQRLETLKEVFSLFKAGRYSECLPLLEKFVSTDENNPKAWEIYGDLSLRTGRHGEAIRAYSRVLALAPPNRNLSFRLSGLYETQGDLREAVRVLEDYARAMPESAPEVRVAIAQLLSRSGDHRSCLVLCEQLLKDGPWRRDVVELRDRTRKLLGVERPAPQAAQGEQGRLTRWVSGLLGAKK